MKIGICFAVLNNFKGLAETLYSIETKHDTRLYIIDQWRYNRPLARAWNESAMQAFNDGCDYALVCNDDILFSSETIDALVKVHELESPNGVVMTTPNNIKLELSNPYDIAQYKLPEDTPMSNSDHPNFSCFLIGRDYFEKIGFFDENFVPAWYEDNDSHRRAKLLGYREICTNLAPMIHFGGVSTSMMENPNSAQSAAYYVKKWGGVPYPESEIYQTPFNDPEMSPTTWRRDDGVIVGPLEVQSAK